MTERRPLIDGLKSTSPGTTTIDSQREREFVHGIKATPTSVIESQQIRRVAMSTRIRADYVKALRRASLERQLQQIEPNTVQDMLEQAIEPWLRSNGYL